MVVDAERRPVADRLAGRDQGVGGRPDRRARIEDPLLGIHRHRQSHAGPAVVHQPQHVGHRLFAEAVPGGGEARHAVALAAAQELVHRHAQRAGHQIVQGDVDGRQRRREHAATLEVLTAVDLLPDGRDTPRVAAEQELAKVIERAAHGELPAAQPRFAESHEAVARLDPDDAEVAAAAGDDVGVYTCDLHGGSLPRHTPAGKMQACGPRSEWRTVATDRASPTHQVRPAADLSRTAHVPGAAAPQAPV